ncbi:unnamed protein product [Lymnaea stagnalis]|uniref:Uncharacterized protein n=1 Tax=Lymnaea stagnalis TaxID=6523 RepID=A0AAV2H2Y4_LYMST
MKAPPTHHPCSLLVFSICLLTLIHWQAAPSQACSLSIHNNKTVLKDLSQYFEKDSSIVIIEYTIRFRNASDEKDFNQKTSSDSFQPWKWYRTHGPESSRLLLTYGNYYGIMRIILSFAIQNVDLVMDVSPPGCLQSLPNGTANTYIRDFLLTDLERSVNQEESSLKDVNICSVRLYQDEGFWTMPFSCCILESNKNNLPDCNEVEESPLTYLIINIVLFIILFSPSFKFLELTKQRIETYHYDLPNDQNVMLNIKVTRNSNPVGYQQVPTIQDIFKFNQELIDETIYTVRIKKACLEIPISKLLREGRSTISFMRIFQDFFFDSSSDSRDTERKWTKHRHWCLKLFCMTRTTVAFYALMFMALPSFLALYAMCDENLWYLQMRKKLNELSNNESEVLETEIVILALLYCLSALVILIIACDTDFKMFSIYFELADDSTITEQVTRFRTLILTKLHSLKKLCSYNCIICLPVYFIIFAIIYILLTILGLFLTSPFTVLYSNLFNKYLMRNNSNRENTKKFDVMKRLLIIINLISILSVVGISTLVLVIIFISLIVLIVVEVSICYKIFPMLFFLWFYVRDAYKEVGNKCDKFMDYIIEDDCFKISGVFGKGSNSMFAINNGSAPSFKEVRSKLCVALKCPFLFVGKDDIKYLSLNFLYHCFTMKWEAAPGDLIQNYVEKTKRLIKIALFLSFVFLIVMAYGSYVFISPDKYLLITFISGLVPKVLEIISTRHSNVKLDERFHESLKEKISTFEETWAVKELDVEISDVTNHDIDYILLREMKTAFDADGDNESGSF